MKIGLVLSAISLCLMPSVSYAQGSPDKAKQMFQKVDKDQNGVLSLGEWTAAGRREQGFRIVDGDADGQVTPSELAAAAAKFGNR